MTRTNLTLITVALAIICVGADYLLKRASEMSSPFRTYYFSLGCILYVVSAPGWVIVFQHSKLSTIGAVFSIVVVLLLAIIGVFAFRENLSATEIVGLIFAVAALALLGRFA